MDFQKIKKLIFRKKVVRSAFSLVIGAFILGFTYNFLLQPNNLMTGGISGFALVVQKITGFSSEIFIYIMTVVLLIISFIFLGKEETKGAIVGSLLYPVMISITAPLVDFLAPHLQLEHMLITVLLAGVLLGFANGIVYKAGYNTGGSDILMKILSKYGKIQEGKANMIISVLIVAMGAFAFGINEVIYALILITISSTLIDKILIGISDTKLFLVQTKKPEEIKAFIIQGLKTGVTELTATGGYSNEESKLLMVVVRTRDYFLFKETILLIDPNAFFVINDCYEVKGGVKRKNTSIFPL